MQIASGYGLSKALLSTVGLGLYTRLAGGPMTLEGVMGAFGLRRRLAMDFLDLLVAADLLGREGDGDGARYHNTEATSASRSRTARIPRLKHIVRWRPAQVFLHSQTTQLPVHSG